jgi:pyruvate,water dikinase
LIYHISQNDVAQPGLGGKADGLFRLARIEVPVPEYIVVSHEFPLHAIESQRQLLEQAIFDTENQLFAVRSSGIGEDSVANSFAGVFDTFLNVHKDNVINSIIKVRKSVDSLASMRYSQARSAQVAAMNVIVQRMVLADYAGVAFTKNPINNDSRVGLIEIVEGLGESLVAGTKTPTSVRYNKLTGMSSIVQKGHDAIDNAALNKIVESLLPLLEKIEDHYGIPVDIEWAIRDNKIYILQARPITV